jgi:DNA-binding Xre family transcriptional regulator
MSEFPKSIVDKLLKEKKKRKYELAKFLDINKNSLNRTLANPNISFRKLEKIAAFLEIDVSELLPKKNRIEDPSGEYYLTNSREAMTVMNLSEVVKRNSRTIETMAETEMRNVINIETLVKLIAGHYSDSLFNTNPEKS